MSQKKKPVKRVTSQKRAVTQKAAFDSAADNCVSVIEDGSSRKHDRTRRLYQKINERSDQSFSSSAKQGYRQKGPSLDRLSSLSSISSDSTSSTRSRNLIDRIKHRRENATKHKSLGKEKTKRSQMKEEDDKEETKSLPNAPTSNNKNNNNISSDQYPQYPQQHPYGYPPPMPHPGMHSGNGVPGNGMPGMSDYYMQQMQMQHQLQQMQQRQPQMQPQMQMMMPGMMMTPGGMNQQQQQQQFVMMNPSVGQQQQQQHQGMDPSQQLIQQQQQEIIRQQQLQLQQQQQAQLKNQQDIQEKLLRQQQEQLVALSNRPPPAPVEIAHRSPPSPVNYKNNNKNPSPIGMGIGSNFLDQLHGEIEERASASARPNKPRSRPSKSPPPPPTQRNSTDSSRYSEGGGEDGCGRGSSGSDNSTSSDQFSVGILGFADKSVLQKTIGLLKKNSFSEKFNPSSRGEGTGGGGTGAATIARDNMQNNSLIEQAREGLSRKNSERRMSQVLSKAYRQLERNESLELDFNDVYSIKKETDFSLQSGLLDKVPRKSFRRQDSASGRNFAFENPNFSH